MGLLEKYKLWEAGKLHESMNPTTLEFFREKPTEKQLLILNERDKNHALLLLLGCVVYLVLGIVIGIAWGVMIA